MRDRRVRVALVIGGGFIQAARPARLPKPNDCEPSSASLMRR